MAPTITDFWSVFDYGVFDDMVFDDPRVYIRIEMCCPGTTSATIDCPGTSGITIDCPLRI